MGSLAGYLQHAFIEHCPRGWSCRREEPLVSKDAAMRLGFMPYADVVLEERSTSRRVWVEFEVSRADPVANHAKFGTSAFLERTHRDGDAFVSMASRHIAPGRLALAAGTAMLMRGFGIAAFQIDLLPKFSAADIKRLNSGRIPAELDARSELERALRVSDAEVTDDGHRIHKVDNHFAVAVNVRQWNAEMLDLALSSVWGRRRVSYCVYDRASRLFAPSKFCAFVPTVQTATAADLPALLAGRPAGMTMPIYATLGEVDKRFDGAIAWKHLHQGLSYDLVKLEGATHSIRSDFERWRAQMAAALDIRDPKLLLPPVRA